MVLNSDCLSYPSKQILLNLTSLHYLSLSCMSAVSPAGLIGWDYCPRFSNANFIFNSIYFIQQSSACLHVASHFK